MKKSYTVDATCNDMRIDRWTRLKIGKIPQGLIEKYFRSGKIKINKKKIKSSTKVKTNDVISFFNLDFLTAFSASASAISNVGPGLGDIIGPEGNYSSLPIGAKWILSFTMLIGRLELFTFLVILSVTFWKK